MINRQTILPIALRFGFFCGVGHAALVTFALAFGFNLYSPVMFFQFVISVIFIQRCIRSIRENEGEGFISFKHAFVSGLMVCFFAFSLLGLVEYIVGAAVFPDMLTDSKNDMLQNLQAMEQFLSESQLEESYKNFEELTLGGLVANDAISKFFWGILLSLILAFIHRRKQPIQL